MNNSSVSASLLSVTASVAIFTSLLPPLADVRKASTNDTVTRADVRLGEGVAFLLVVAVGLLGASLTSSPAPAMLSVVVGAGLVLVYESVLSNNPKESTV